MLDEVNYSIRCPLRKEKGWKTEWILLADGIYSEYNVSSLYFGGGKMDKLISIVIPCYNEEKTIYKVVTDFMRSYTKNDGESK